MSHTPGPWKLESTTFKNRCGMVTASDGTPFIVADIYGVWPHVPEAMDNGRLIAAAPDLLEAAKMRVAYQRRVLPPPGADHDCHWCGACIARMERMEAAAIAKAEGRR